MFGLLIILLSRTFLNDARSIAKNSVSSRQQYALKFAKVFHLCKKSFLNRHKHRWIYRRYCAFAHEYLFKNGKKS